MVSEIQYGGRITDDRDRLLLITYAKVYEIFICAIFTIFVIFFFFFLDRNGYLNHYFYLILNFMMVIQYQRSNVLMTILIILIHFH